MLKRILSLCLIIVILSTITIHTLASDYANFYNGVVYRFFDDEPNVVYAETLTEDASGDIIIPNTLEGREVRIYQHSTFGKRANVTSITLPESTTVIDDMMFSRNPSMTKIYIPAGVTAINSGAFRGKEGSTEASYGSGALTDIYYGGTEEQWNSIVIDNSWDSSLSEEFWNRVTVHYNCTGIDQNNPQPEQSIPQAYEFYADKSEGKANINNLQGTGDTFYFTAVTSDDVTQIGIGGDKSLLGEKDHIIPHQFLEDNYFLEGTPNGDGTITWTCKFGINVPGQRELRLYLNGSEKPAEGVEPIKLTIFEQQPEPEKDTSQPIIIDWYCEEGEEIDISFVDEITIVAEAEDNEELDYAIFELSGIGNIGNVYFDDYGYATMTIDTSHCYEGWNEVTITAVDKAGNRSPLRTVGFKLFESMYEEETFSPTPGQLREENHEIAYEKASYSNGMEVFVNGQEVYFDVKPRLINDRTMVPLRAIFETLGARVDWDEATQTVTAYRGDVTIELTIGDSYMYVNGYSVYLDSPAVKIDDRTLVPVRAISESFGCEVEWYEDKELVSIAE